MTRARKALLWALGGFGALLLIGIAIGPQQPPPGRPAPESRDAPTPKPVPVREPINPAENVTIKKFTWQKTEIVNVMIASFTIENKNEAAVKDVEIACSLFGNSDTKLGTASKTFYDVIPPNGSKRFTEVNMGFVNDQASKANCSVAKVH